MKSISQTKFLSENYTLLHGLNAVPVGLVLFSVSLWANIVQYPIKNFTLPIVLILVFLLSSLAVDQYYKRTFGEVKPILARRRQYWILQSICGLLGIAAFLADISFHFPINFVGLLFAALFLLDKPTAKLPLNKFTTVRLISSLCIIFVSIAPLFFGKNWWNILGVRTTLIGVTMFVGVLVAIQGAIWHIFFVNSLPVKEAKDE